MFSKNEQTRRILDSKLGSDCAIPHLGCLVPQQYSIDNNLTRMCIAQGTSPNIYANKHSTLINTASPGHIDTVEFLLNEGAQADMVLKLGYGTALATATFKGRARVFRLLITWRRLEPHQWTAQSPHNSCRLEQEKNTIYKRAGIYPGGAGCWSKQPQGHT